MSRMKMTPEKELLIGMIVSDEFLQQIAPLTNVAYLQASSSRIIAKWCLEYYEEYKTAPKELIQDIYTQHLSILDDTDTSIIAKVLAHISEKYAQKDKYNIPYMIDKSSEYLRKRRLEVFQTELEHYILRNDVTQAENLIGGYATITKPEQKIRDLWSDTTIVDNIFSRENYELFKLPGILGEYVGSFRRGNLYAFAGVAKRGKSRWLAQTAVIASMHRLNVAYISLEMDDEETAELILNTMVRKPITDREELQGTETIVKLPYFSEQNDILYENLKTHYGDVADYKKWQKKANMAYRPMHRIIGQPDKMTIEDIENELLTAEYYDEFVPDVIVVDYANLLHAKGTDNRDKVNTIWTGLKRLAKNMHCPVITATHMNSDALKKDGENYNVGEDRRILHHVSGLYILNQTEEEKKNGIMRIKATATRFSKYTELDQVLCLYDFNTGRTLIDSRWLKDIPEYTDAE
jgi:replicative DNA helicase